MPSPTLQGAIWDGHLVSPGIGVELHKPKGDGGVEVNGLLSRTQVCRSLDEVLDVNEQWRFGYAWIPGGRDRWLPWREGDQMAYGIVHFFAGGTKEQYDASLAAVHPRGTGLPKGQTFHAAGPSAGGWTVIAIHESKESWERFRDDILMPTLQKGVKGGFIAPPQEQAFEVYNLRP